MHTRVALDAVGCCCSVQGFTGIRHPAAIITAVSGVRRLWRQAADVATQHPAPLRHVYAIIVLRSYMALNRVLKAESAILEAFRAGAPEAIRLVAAGWLRSVPVRLAILLVLVERIAQKRAIAP